MPQVSLYSGSQNYGINQYTKLWMKCDQLVIGNPIDDSGQGHIISNTAATIDTTNKKWGVGSLLFDGSTTFMTTPDSADWHFGANEDFTIDMQYRRQTGMTASSLITLVSNCSGLGNTGPDINWGIIIDTTDFSLHFYMFNGGSHVILDSTTLLNATSFYHIAIVRYSNRVDMYINGTSEANGNYSLASIATPYSTFFGAGYGAGALYRLSGNLDEIRIQKGEAFWHSNFTPPTRGYWRVR